MTKVLSILAIVAVVALLAFSFAYGMDKTERVECYTWQKQAQEFAGFYLLQWQADQCAAQGIAIDAVIK